MYMYVYAMLCTCTCIDIDECASGLDECEQLCDNTEGSYNCSCMKGYELAENGRNCSGKFN